jgi:D-alanine-D-alanine ligase
MSIQVNENWWKNIFDEIYLLTDARSVCNEELTKEEVDFLEKTFLVNKNAAILDQCGGQGRHSLELSRRGFKNVVVLDYSKYLVYLGKKNAAKEKLNTTFIQGDARTVGVCNHSIKYLIIMASSFGYFTRDKENQKILKEAFRLLQPKGKILLDLPKKEYVVNKFKPSSNHKVDNDITVTREREIRKDVIYSRETITSKSKGCLRINNYCTRLYTPEEITQLLYKTGFSSVVCTLDFMNRDNEADYGCMTNRMIIIAEKE